MTKDCDQVAVDTAFLIKIVESDNGILFEKIMKQMNRIPVIHEYVYQHEVMENRAIKGLIDKNIINYSDFLLEEFDKEQYERIFRQTYKGMNGQRLHEKENIFFLSPCRGKSWRNTYGINGITLKHRSYGI